MTGDREKCLEAGMDDCVSKPIDGAALLAPIDSIPERIVAAPPCDLRAFLGRIGGDEDLARQMAALFSEDAVQLVAGVREAVEAGDADKLKRVAHALKGAAGNFDAHATVELASVLERQAAGGHLADAGHLCGRLEREASRLVAVLQAYSQAGTCAS